MYSSIIPGVLFFILSPGILTRIPKNGDKYLVTFVHSIIFAALLYFLMRNLPIYEGNEPMVGDTSITTIFITIALLIAAIGIYYFPIWMSNFGMDKVHPE